MRAALIALWLGVFGISATFDAAPASASCLPGILQQRLSQIRSQFGSVTIISTHRPGARVAGSGRRSLHASCRAVDFKVSGNKGAAIAWLKANHNGGVGTYSCGMNHIHIDNGPRVRFHKCVSASGRGRSSRRYARSYRKGNAQRYATSQRRQRRSAGQEVSSTW